MGWRTATVTSRSANKTQRMLFKTPVACRLGICRDQSWWSILQSGSCLVCALLISINDLLARQICFHVTCDI